MAKERLVTGLSEEQLAAQAAVDARVKAKIMARSAAARAEVAGILAESVSAVVGQPDQVAAEAKLLERFPELALLKGSVSRERYAEILASMK